MQGMEAWVPDLQAQITALRRELRACQTEALGKLAGRIEDACSQLESEALRISGLTDASCQVGLGSLSSPYAPHHTLWKHCQGTS